jgi:hypothetical protein
MRDEKQQAPPSADSGGAFEREGVAYREVELAGEDVIWAVYAGADGDVLVDKRDGHGLVRPDQTWVDGYLMVSIRRIDGRYAQRRVHQLVATSFLGPRPSPAHVVDHIDGIPTHNGLENLRWVTPKENRDNRSRHMQRQRRSARGRTRVLPIRMSTAVEVQRRTGLKGRRLYCWVDRVLKNRSRTMRHAQ